MKKETKENTKIRTCYFEQKAIIDYILKKNMTPSKWIRSATQEKFKRESKHK